MKPVLERRLDSTPSKHRNSVTVGDTTGVVLRVTQLWVERYVIHTILQLTSKLFQALYYSTVCGFVYRKYHHT